MPHEFAISGVYIPPLLLVAAVAYLCANITSFIAVKQGWHRYIVSPALVELCLFIIYISLIGLFIPVV